MSQAIEEALTALDPTGLDESVEELLAAAETEADRSRQQVQQFNGSDREPLRRAIALLGGTIVAAYANANPTQALSADELRQELLDAAAVAKQRRDYDPANHPLGPVLHGKLHQAFLELHRRNGRYQRLGEPSVLAELVEGIAALAGEIASAMDCGEGSVL
jgi:hypothetical protein